MSNELSKHLTKTKASEDNGVRFTSSASQIMKDLAYKIPKRDSASDEQSTSKEDDQTKGAESGKPKFETDDEGFKITQEIAQHQKKKTEEDTSRKVVSRILAKSLDPSRLLTSMIGKIHDLKPYGLNEGDWRIFLTYLKNQDQRWATLPQVAKQLVVELETKITEAELIRDLVTDPLGPQVQY